MNCETRSSIRGDTATGGSILGKFGGARKQLSERLLGDGLVQLSRLTRTHTQGSPPSEAFHVLEHNLAARRRSISVQTRPAGILKDANPADLARRRAARVGASGGDDLETGAKLATRRFGAFRKQRRRIYFAWNRGRGAHRWAPDRPMEPPLKVPADGRGSARLSLPAPRILSAVPNAAQVEYRLALRDFPVFQVPISAQTVKVPMRSGQIAMPRRVQAGGKTVSELETEIKTKL